MKNILLLCAILLVWGECLIAQDLYYSHYQAVPFLSNPAMILPDTNFSAQIYHRHQPVYAGQRFSTSSLSLGYPLLPRQSSQPWASIGLSFLDHRQPQSISSQGVLLGLTYHLNLPQSTLSFAMQGGFIQTGLAITDITTRSQFVPGSGFDPDLPTQENLNNLQKLYGVLSAGLNWAQYSTTGRVQHSLGLSMMNMNRPRVDFTGQREEEDVFRLSPNFVLHGGWEIYHENQIYIQPNFRLIYRQGNYAYQLGSWFGYELLPHTYSNPLKQGNFQLGLWYFSNRALTAAISLNQPRYQFSFSYDVPVSRTSELWLGSGAFELGLTVKISTRRKSRPISDSEITVLQTQPFKTYPLAQVKEASLIVPVIEDTYTVEDITLIFEPFYIKFNTNDEITSISKQKMDDFVAYWRNYPDTKIQISGYAYNQGGDEQNLANSKQIAEKVKEYFNEAGVEPEKMYTEGRGAQKITIIGDDEIGNFNFLVKISAWSEDE